MYSYEKVLPIGTVVLLQGAQRRAMIIGYQRTAANNDERIYDYCGCPYPEGYMSPEKTFLFDHEQIDRLISIGFQNAEEVEFQEKLREIIDARENGKEKGKEVE